MKIKEIFLPLKELQKKINSEELKEILLKFKCSYDPEIEEFLQNKALEYEKRNWCATYLLMDADKIKSGEMFVEGFFSLSFKAIELSEKVSNSRRKLLFNGLSKKDNSVPFVLIGQMGKYIEKKENEDEKKSPITSNDLLKGSYDIIQQVNHRVPIKSVLVECKALEKLCNMYEECGFRKLQENELMQYFKKI